MMKKVWVAIVLLMLVSLAYLIIAPINFNIDRVVTAQRANMLAPYETEEIEIRIQGRYSFCLIRNNQFDGKIIIEGYEFTRRAIVNLLSSLDLFRTRVSSGHQFETYLLGYIRTSFLLRNVDIVVFNGLHESNYRSGYINWENDDNVFITTGNIEVRYSQFMDLLRKRYYAFIGQ